MSTASLLSVGYLSISYFLSLFTYGVFHKLLFHLLLSSATSASFRGPKKGSVIPESLSKGCPNHAVALIKYITYKNACLSLEITVIFVSGDSGGAGGKGGLCPNIWQFWLGGTSTGRCYLRAAVDSGASTKWTSGFWCSLSPPLVMQLIRGGGFLCQGWGERLCEDWCQIGFSSRKLVAHCNGVQWNWKERGGNLSLLMIKHENIIVSFLS